ncbi:metallophosphoesterase [Clostridium botulinum]|uniref:Serine/threonine protein phosphatase n=1 Tax=Clostridium botulinum C/D str. DC5 TaxID=1443128 RepID=A0A0A0IEZ4_CLOBO|nr:metallophosphoesterase [Clostridium botulinum]KEI06663.1 serine/threonine protein phosphatase [Clostridium botulinum C/D str. BKT75002]KEI09575.1 serine/threonine protein phosphatase [Clostridium botulinum C/D str. BKT2873]KGM94518.1 serine/threonine protein phosphatase [Clostridium botulinum D str. CCUG 7971]KGM98846.1 serine/threonine protein phosphatase [Clostridium botulinum C/D str. DC5]KOC55562.1 serine/threonine protein phosphatase [Clostridium botulinum]
MALYAISDLHLSLNSDKPMDVFGEHWSNHDERIKENWINKITNEDTVLIAGDISWSMKMEDGMEDLEWIHKLPGKKIISKGNHDYWWGSISKLNSLYEDINFIQNNYFVYENYAICGTRGWNPPSDKYTQHDEKIYNREQIRLRISLDSAKKAGYEKIIVMIHYPPVNDKFEETELIKIFKEYNVQKVIYGHLHGTSLKNVFEGNHDGVEYIMTACDYINFDPISIL